MRHSRLGSRIIQSELEVWARVASWFSQAPVTAGWMCGEESPTLRGPTRAPHRLATETQTSS